jgi:hypothetical protein
MGVTERPGSGRDLGLFFPFLCLLCEFIAPFGGIYRRFDDYSMRISSAFLCLPYVDHDLVWSDLRR